jgi:hypothetical protein
MVRSELGKRTHSSGYANGFWAEVTHYVQGRKLDQTKNRMAEKRVVGSWNLESI